MMTLFIILVGKNIYNLNFLLFNFRVKDQFAEVKFVWY